MTKQELRKIYLQKRRALQDRECEELNKRLCDRFFSAIDLSAIRVLHTFLPIEKNREVDTWSIIRRMKEQHPQIRIAVPRINNRTSGLEHFYLERDDQIALNAWDIPEPVSGIPLDSSAIDLVLVPLLAFDHRGHRLGYGRGFYDRFLATCRPDCAKVGLSYFEPVEYIDDVHGRDVLLDKIVTPDGVYAPDSAQSA